MKAVPKLDESESGLMMLKKSENDLWIRVYKLWSVGRKTISCMIYTIIHKSVTNIFKYSNIYSDICFYLRLCSVGKETIPA